MILTLWLSTRAQKGTTRLTEGYNGCGLHNREALFIDFRPRDRVAWPRGMKAWHAFSPLPASKRRYLFGGCKLLEAQIGTSTRAQLALELTAISCAWWDRPDRSQ